MKFQSKPQSTIFGKLDKVWKWKRERKAKNILKSIVIKEACSVYCWNTQGWSSDRRGQPMKSRYGSETDWSRFKTWSQNSREWERLKHPTGPGREKVAHTKGEFKDSVDWLKSLSGVDGVGSPGPLERQGWRVKGEKELRKPGEVAPRGGFCTAIRTYPTGMQKEASCGSWE